MSIWDYVRECFGIGR